MCEKRWFMKAFSEVGSGSVLGLGLIFMVLGIMTTSLGFTTQSLAIARLQAQADNAVIAGEDVLRGLATGFPCETAEEIVKEFGGTLEKCHKVNLDLYISVRTEVMGIVQRVQARATPG
jgi:secretion/DNA translocation related TadE-like protein